LCLTEIGKRWVGRLRPHFIAVCSPNLNTLNCTTTTLTGIYYNPIYTGGSFCSNNNAAAVKEARMSFPSGHSSYSWYTMLFLIIFIEARLFLLRLRYIKPLIQLCAFSAAFVTMLSRVSDYHHRGSDVIGGTFLGCIVALFVTFVVGKVMWVYETEISYSELDLKEYYKQKKSKN
jgi:phosphatidate phosphatase